MNRTLLVLGLVVLIATTSRSDSFDTVLFEKDSKYNHIMVIEDADGLRTLLFEEGGARQSVVKIGDPDHLELPYARAVPIGLSLVEKPAKVLIIGLGGGTIPMFLRTHWVEMEIDAVDIDPMVIAVASGFFDFREDERLRAHAEDGRKFVEARKSEYDVIILDAYGRDSIPYHLGTLEFLEAVRRALKPGGVVIGNVWSRFSNPLYDSMVHTYQKAFDELYTFTVRDCGNRIFVGLTRPERVDREAMARRARKLSTEKGFRFDLGEIADYGYRRVTGRKLTAPVLHDKKRASPAPKAAADG